MALPEEGKFTVQSIGPVKNGTSKSTGRPYKIYSLQFQGDPQWYDTFWSRDDEPKDGMELEGTKSYDGKYDSYQFQISRAGGKANFNPAAAQAAVIGASVAVINGFLAIPKHYELWAANKSEELKPLFEKYMQTIETVSKRMKTMTVGLGSIQGEAQKSETTSAAPANDGDPGPVPPPDMDMFDENPNFPG